MVSCVGVHTPNTGWIWPSTRPGMTALPPASSTASALVSAGGSRAAILAPSISNDVTAAWGLPMSPVKNSPMFLMRSVDTALHHPLYVAPGFMPASTPSLFISRQDVDGRDIGVLERRSSNGYARPMTADRPAETERFRACARL